MVEVTVLIATRSAGSVRLIYAVPSDRSVRADYREAIQRAAVDLQSWMRQQMGGLTFSLFQTQPEVCELGRPSDAYLTGTFSKVVDDLQSCQPIGYNSSEHVWAVYADVVHACDTPGRLGVGGSGLTILGRQDLEGLVGASVVTFDCGEPSAATLAASATS